MRLGYLGIALIYLTCAGAELTLHWCMGRESAGARQLREKYLYRDPDNGKQYVAGLVRCFVPALIVGIAAGIIAHRSTPNQLTWCVLVLSLGLLVLLPFYDVLLSPYALDPVAGRPRTIADVVFGYITGYVTMAALCGVLAYGARVLTEYFRHRIEVKEREQG